MVLVSGMAVSQAPVPAGANSLQEGEVVWEENFEDRTLGYEIVNDAAHWLRAEVRGTDNDKITLSAAVSGNEGHKYLKVSATQNAERTQGPTVILSTNAMSEMGLNADEPFTVSYDFKTGRYDGSVPEYYHSISGSDNYSNNAQKQMYFRHKLENGNTTAFYNDGKMAAAVQSIDSSRAVPSGTIYPAGWNSLQWVVHASSTPGASYAELYLNGTYSGTLALTNSGEFARYLVFGICMKSGVESAELYLDNIKITKGAYTKQATAKNAVVNAVTTGFEEVAASKNGANDVSVPPVISQPEDQVKIVNDSEYMTFETAANQFGKAENDMALHIQGHNASGVSNVPTDSRIEMYFENNKSTKLYETGDSQEISFDFAYDNVVGPITITPYLYNDDCSDKIKAVSMIEVKQDRVNVLGKTFTLGDALKIQTWYNVRVILTMGTGAADNSVTVYLTNGDKTEIFTADLDNYSSKVGGNTKFRGFQQCWIHYKHENYDKDKGVWYDNFSIKSYIGGASYPVISQSGQIDVSSDANSVTAKALVINDGGGAKEALILAVYREADGNVVLDNIVFDCISGGAAAYSLSCTADVPDDGFAKAMLWDGVDSMKSILPLREINP